MNNNSRYEKFRQYLSKSKEEELYNLMKNGDMDARDELILAHSYLVIKIANQYSKYGPLEDLEQEGFVALTKAVDKYNFRKGRLRTYCYQTVRTHILRFLAKNTDVIKLPEPQVHQLLLLLRIKEKLAIELKRDPTYDELMKNKEVIKAYKDYSKKKDTKFTLKEYVDLIGFSEPIFSLNEPIAEDSNILLEDVIEDPTSESEHKKIELDDIGNNVMEILTDREKLILKSCAKGLTGQEIGSKLGITTQAVSESRLRSIRKIKKYVKDDPELSELISNLGFKL